MHAQTELNSQARRAGRCGLCPTTDLRAMKRSATSRARLATLFHVLWRCCNCRAVDARHMLLLMRKGTRFAMCFCLLAALLLAAQPLIVALDRTLQALQGAPEFGALIICTTHGAVTQSDEGGAEKKTPAQKVPDCPFCALGYGSDSKAFLVVTGLEAAPPRHFIKAIAGIFAGHEVPQPRLRLVTAPPRGPPQHA
jgi:hypothetical protein